MSAERGPASSRRRRLRRELPLCDSFNERNTPFAERMLALGEGYESRSDSNIILHDIVI
jgi:hypothetical protein